MPKLSSFLSELKRRRVFRVAVVYAGVAFIVFQIVDATFDVMGIPDWLGRFLIVVLLLGFLVAVGLAWAFDITEKGVVKTPSKEEVAEAKRAPHIVIGNKTLAIVAVVAVAVAVWSWWGRPSSAGPITSIAVLPLENLMNDPDQDYFVDGMHEALISELGKISALRVISRTSAMHYKDTDKLLPEIARELNVDAVVEGSVLRAGNRVRITAQLVGTAPERHLWTDNYTRDLVDILELHSEVARAIAQEIRVTLTPKEEARLASARFINPEAYEAYLKGRYFWNKRTEEDIKQAIAHFQRAIEIDPTYALAYAGLADSYVVPANPLPPREALPRAKAAATKGLEIDSTLAEAHTSLAAAMMQYDWDWSGAGREFQRAIELNPNYATAHQWYAEYLAATGRLDEAIAEVKRAEELDPLSLIISWNVGRILMFARQYDQALEQGRKILELYPNSARTHNLLAKAYEQKGMYDEAIAEYEEAVAYWGFPEEVIDEVRQLYAVGDIRGYWQKWFDILERPSMQAAVDLFQIILIYARTGEKELAFEWLGKAYKEQDLGWFIVDLKMDPMLEPLRSDPRFQDLLRRMNFPE